MKISGTYKNCEHIASEHEEGVQFYDEFALGGPVDKAGRW